MAIDWVDVFLDTRNVLYKSRPYYKSWVLAHDVHDGVVEALRLAQPKNLHLLALECPHAKSEQEADKLRYLRGQAHVNLETYQHKWTETPLSKYLAKHFPHVPSHHLREISSKYAEIFDIVTDLSEMINTAVKGPRSCMKREDLTEDEVHESHPYRAYDPAHGWAMARHVNIKGEIIGRAIIHTPSKTFVRTYAPQEREGVNQESMPLNSWLLSKGYTKARSWPSGAKLAWIDFDNDSDFLVPFLDGDLKRVSKDADVLILDWDGKYVCDCTDGSASILNLITCYDCECEMDEEDGLSVGYYGHMVCNGCMEDYVYVRGAHGEEYYVHVDNAIQTIEEEWYDEDHLSRYGIEQIDCGRHAGGYTSNPVTLYDGRIVHNENEDLVELSSDSEYAGDWALTDDTFYCEHSEQYFLAQEDKPINLGGYTIAAVHIRSWLEDNPEYVDEYEASLVDHSAQVTLPLENECVA